MREFTAVVVDVRLERQVGVSGRWQMALDETAFKAGMTGVLEAESRMGTRLELAVSEVLVDAEGVVWHGVEKPLAAGTAVRGRVFDRAGEGLV